MCFMAVGTAFNVKDFKMWRHEMNWDFLRIFLLTRESVMASFTAKIYYYHQGNDQGILGSKETSIKPDKLKLITQNCPEVEQTIKY